MKLDSKIYIAGHRGMVGSAIVHLLKTLNYSNLILRSRHELDLTRQFEVEKFFDEEKPEYVILAAGKVGGIMANKNFKADFIYQNLLIQSNVIASAFENSVKKLLFLGSSCIYPRLAPQPISESDLLSGPLEPTNDAYAVAKIAGIKLCQAYQEQHGADFFSVMPTNLYGPNDNFNLETSHVLPALIYKFHRAKVQSLPSVTLWGTGSAFREFLHVDDLAIACVHLMNSQVNETLINVGTGKDISIKNLAYLVCRIVGYEGKINWDSNKPDGTPRKLLNVDLANKLGWKASVSLEKGIQQTYDWFVKEYREKQ
ncbi:MAG: GDP-L-fucose synthase [bacterium]|nr:GDP-L-fucose synthase [bacterium]